MTQSDYDKGFADGLKCVANTFRASATIVERSTYSTFESKTNGKMVKAIAKVGDVAFARRLRDVAKLIEDTLNEPAPSH